MSSTVWDKLLPKSEIEKNAIDFLKNLKNIPNALLLFGIPSFNKEQVALSFAAKLQCSNDGCGECKNCISALENRHPNIICSNLEKPNVSVADIKGLIEKSYTIGTKNLHKVIIINNIEKMVERTSNYLLKAIEEPAGKTIWILTTDYKENILPTILSRCLLVNLGCKKYTIPDDLAKANIRENIFKNIFNLKSKINIIAYADKLFKEIEKNAKKEYENNISKKSDELEQITGENKILKGIKVEEKKRQVNKIIKEQLFLITDYVFSFWDDVLTYKHTKNDDNIINTDILTNIHQMAEEKSFENIHSILSNIKRAKDILETNVAMPLVVEYLFLNIV